MNKRKEAKKIRSLKFNYFFAKTNSPKRKANGHEQKKKMTYRSKNHDNTFVRHQASVSFLVEDIKMMNT